MFLFFCSQSLTFATVFLLDNSSRMVSAVFMPLLVILIEAPCPSIFHGLCAELGLSPLPQGRALKVLVVDDDPVAVEMIAVRIPSLGSTVLRAFGGREAIDIARRELPDLIVLDLMMPEVNGFDVLAALDEHPDTARIPILVVTARQITAEDRAKLHGNVTTIMEKADFDRDRFMAEVRRAMSGRRLAA